MIKSRFLTISVSVVDHFWLVNWTSTAGCQTENSCKIKYFWKRVVEKVTKWPFDKIKGEHKSICVWSYSILDIMKPLFCFWHLNNTLNHCMERYRFVFKTLTKRPTLFTWLHQSRHLGTIDPIIKFHGNTIYPTQHNTNVNLVVTVQGKVRASPSQ